MNRHKLALYLEKIESGYKANPYHNSTHAADVLQTMRSLLILGKMYPRVVDLLGVLSCYLAAIIHDYEHTGFTNDFLILTDAPMAVQYNYKSPQENHHVAAALALLNKEEYNFMENLTREQRFYVKHTVRSLSLSD